MPRRRLHTDGAEDTITAGLFRAAILIIPATRYAILEYWPSSIILDSSPADREHDSISFS